MNSKFLFLALSISTALSAQKQPTLIPFSLENNSVYIQGKVNAVDNVKFLFDTGADGSVINTNSKKK
ncbi:hypothetical protein BBH99_13820 [Chryseobacterium contaminans]|uniref:Peptidase A2 domain-containing protein n=1 Tax=Chryseobacterium contaminans TaxID=1423959 RepID=A0A1M7BZK9_9FLAO|nr:hypothetical protein [Chryseobacterium contaminans]OCA71060.1 hypothetical protein BBH99_13820 [Chryseobacterium contaminans]SHL60019.1 hypothetical protein SAMN05444407_10518 [Chryseobacterium contaminans]